MAPLRYVPARLGLVGVALAVAMALLLGLAGSDPGHAQATITVTSVDDSNVPGDGKCTLREAIVNANQTAAPFDMTYGDCAAGTAGLDTINFTIAGMGVHTISPTRPLPAITSPVLIDGYSQPGARSNRLAVGSDAILLIELDGSQVTQLDPGFRVVASGTALRGLVIDRFPRDGIEIAASGVTVAGCFIGVDPGGTFEQGNRGFGIWVKGVPNATIGGTTAADRNVVSGNWQDGIVIGGTGATGTIVQGNYVGTNAAGTAAIGNRREGIQIADAPANTIGGTAPGAGNVIAGNLYSGVYLTSAGATGNHIEGNAIGTNAAGTAALGNRWNGVYVVGAPNNRIGGTANGARNFIAGNGYSGIAIANAGATGNVVESNSIGVGGNSIYALPNGQHGILLTDTSGNTIGGTDGLVGNFITRNTGAGVAVQGASTGNAILHNAIFDNGGLGIDLGSAGVLPNDSGDADTGPNGGQNYPVLAAVYTKGSGTTIIGVLNSTPSKSFRVEFFSDWPGACDASGYGEGRVYVGSTTVSTDGSGNAGFTAFLPGVGIGAGVPITSTATDQASNSTSEFSACRVAVPPPGVVVEPTGGLVTTEQGGSAHFTVRLASAPTANVTIPLSSSDPKEGTVAPTSLTFTPGNALTPQTVTVTGVNDAQVDGAVGYTIVLGAATSADPAYQGLDAPDVGITNQDDDVAQAACAPRPNVVLGVAPDGPGRLRVTVTAGTNALTPNNRLHGLRFLAGGNGLVDIGGQQGLSGDVTVPLPTRPTSVTFWVRRASTSQATTLRFVVEDDCGSWPTFVGGGPAAF